MSWFIFGNSYKKNVKNLKTLEEQEAYDILNTAFEDADASGMRPVLKDILASYTGKNDKVKNIIINQFLLTYPKSPEAEATKGATAPAAGGRRSTRKTKKTKKSKRSKRGSRRV
jgi:hypothetical protein